MERDLEALRRELARAREIIQAKERRIADLTEEIADLQQTLASLQRERTTRRPEARMPSVSAMLRSMREGPINLHLPRPGHVIPVENPSARHVSLAPRTVRVPNVVGVDREAAAAAIRAARLRVGRVASRASVTPPGRVMDQKPGAHTRVEAGTRVDLIVSKVRETRVPDVIGLERDRAAGLIAAAHLTVGDVTETISDASPGTVIGQGIPGGAAVPYHTALNLIVARRETTEVPDLVGASVHRARKRVTGARLEVGDVARKPSKEPPGTVIRQRPDAGQEVVVTTPVQLVVARPRPATVPHVRGLDWEDALEAIESAGLALGEVIREPSDRPPGTVVGLEPEPGTELEPGSEVVVRVSR